MKCKIGLFLISFTEARFSNSIVIDFLKAQDFWGEDFLFASKLRKIRFLERKICYQFEGERTKKLPQRSSNV